MSRTSLAIPSQLPGSSFLDAEGGDYGVLEVSNQSGNDDIDAHDFYAAPYNPGVDGDVYFSIAGSGDIYLNNINNVYLSAAELGIAGEDLDALIVEPGVGVLFSTATAGSAADVFFSDGTGSNSVFITAADMSLLSSDNLNALSSAAVPEPSSLVFLGTCLLGLLGLRRRAGLKGERHV